MSHSACLQRGTGRVRRARQCFHLVGPPELAYITTQAMRVRWVAEDCGSDPCGTSKSSSPSLEAEHTDTTSSRAVECRAVKEGTISAASAACCGLAALRVRSALHAVHAQHAPRQQVTCTCVCPSEAQSPRLSMYRLVHTTRNITYAVRESHLGPQNPNTHHPPPPRSAPEAGRGHRASCSFALFSSVRETNLRRPSRAPKERQEHQ